MTQVVSVLVAYWPVLIAPVLLLVVSLINARLPYASLRQGPALARAVGVLIDWLAASTRRDSPGTLALPLLQLSRPPEAPATPARRAGDDRVTPLLPVLLLLALGGCTPAQGAQAGRAFGTLDKVMTWVCRAWPTVRAGAERVLPAPPAPASTDATDRTAPPSELGAPVTGRDAQASSGGAQ